MLRQFWRASAILTILPAIAAAGSGLIQVTGIHSFSHPDSTRVVLETTGKTEFRAQREYNPDRLVFDVLHARPWIERHRYLTHQVNDTLVRRVRIAEKTPGTTRIVFDLTEPAYYRVTRLETPDRMVIEVHPMRPHGAVNASFPQNATALERRSFVWPPSISSRPRLRAPIFSGAAPQFDPAPLESIYFPGPMLEITLARPPRVRVGPPMAVVAPAAPVASGGAATLNMPAGPALKATSFDAKGFDAKPMPSSNASRSLTRALGLKINRIVIDAGHGGHDQGTVGPNGVLEKDVVLDVALRVAKLVQSRMGAEVVLTRSDDTFVPLHERTAMANDRKADLFLSIHANSSPASSVAGTETFFLNFTNNSTALDVAARENAGADKNVGELKDLIQSITLNDKIAESQTFAQTIQTSLFAQAARSNAAARNRGVKRAPFVVLIGASMPSVLAEIGFLSNAHDESNLGKTEYRQKIAEALYKGLAQYCQSLSHFEVASEKPVASGLN